MAQFDSYSEFYNLLYRDKDYAGETAYVSEKIRKHRPGARTLLDLGCGTARHDVLLSQCGFSVTGVDMSKTMLEHAAHAVREAGVRNIHLCHSDIRTFGNGKSYDAAVSLFHVMSYQTTNKDVSDVLRTVSAHLKPGGLFLFDFWYGPAVLSDKPAVRVKRMENESIAVTRIAEPAIDYSANVVTVNYDVFIRNKRTQAVDEIRETHRMRYFFEPELIALLEHHGFTLLEAEEWMTGSSLSDASWNAVLVCRTPARKRGAKA